MAGTEVVTATPALSSPTTLVSVTERERLYARAALDGCADEIAAAPKGTRNDVLNRKAFRLGTMAVRGWINRTEVIDTLFTAAETCGLNADDGEEATRKTLESGLANGEKHPHPDLETGQQEGFTEPPAPHASWKYCTVGGKSKLTLPSKITIKGILPETGAALVAGQWGTFKTTLALDVSVCVMAGLPFAGRYRVGNRDAILLYVYTLEGEGMLSAHLAGCCHTPLRLPVRLPFAWRGDCPPLPGKSMYCRAAAPSPTRRQLGSTAILVCRWC